MLTVDYYGQQLVPVSPETLFSLLLSGEELATLLGRTIVLQPWEFGRLSIEDEEIQGEFRLIDPPNTIQARLVRKNAPDTGVEWRVQAVEGGCLLELRQRGLLGEEGGYWVAWWEDHYLPAIRYWAALRA
jgi:hypothetical protein